MPVALPLQTAISQASSAGVEFRVLMSQYGNGYSQRAPDGINNAIHSWDVVWDNLTASEFTTVVNAIEAAKGADYFTWQAPGDAASKKYVISAYSKSALAGEIYSVSATLKQVFDV
jgi:phage-related protein